VETLRLLLIAVLAVGAAHWAPATARGQAAPQPGLPAGVARASDRQIQASIRGGVNYLMSKAASSDGGIASLAAMALLKTGVPADAPVIQAVIKKITSRIVDAKFTPSNAHDHIYESGVSLMALANADAKKYLPQIQNIADYILSHQGPQGDWDYLQRTTGDTSISQYALLGLWEASRCGVDVPIRVWDKAAQWHVSRQQTDGSFVYHPSATDGTGTHSMTVAGVGSLLVTRLHLYPDARDVEEQAVARQRRRGTRKKYGLLEPADTEDDPVAARAPDPSRPTVRLAAIDRAVGRGTDWLAERFTVDPPLTWKLYYLYGVERTAALANLTTIGGHDWYAEGAGFLIGQQFTDGSWTEQAGIEAATSFAILFLSKATAKMLNRRAPKVSRFGAGLLAGGRGLPDNLNEVEFEGGKVQVRKLAGPVDELLAELENAQSQKVESAQAALVDLALVENREALVGKLERLVKLVHDPRPEVRRTALWALGRSNDIRTAPLLIEALLDSDLDCMVEARNALQFLAKKSKDLELPDQPTAAQRSAAVARWRKWYRSIRPYDERDDLPEATGS
jgi:hypothetical protein